MIPKTGTAVFGEGSVVLPALKSGAPSDEYSLDYGVAHYVNTLREHGIETFESCQGGKGHCFHKCTVRFFGGRGEGFRALAIAHTYGFPVSSLERSWPVIDGEPTGPWWKMVFKYGNYIFDLTVIIS